MPKALLETGSPDELTTAIGHELAHVAWRDYPLAVLTETLMAVAGFHPAAWWIKRNLDIARQQACDEAVTGALVSPEAYVQALVSLAGQRTTFGLALIDNPNLDARVARILTHRPRGFSL